MDHQPRLVKRRQVNQPRTFLNAIRLGEKYGYPKCCVMQFAKELIEGKEPFKMRGLDPSWSYVPCDAHKALMDKVNENQADYEMARRVRAVNAISQKTREILGEKAQNTLPLAEEACSNGCYSI